MKYLITFLIAVLLCLQGCRTVAGAGQDITWLAEKLETVEAKQDANRPRMATFDSRTTILLSHLQSVYAFRVGVFQAVRVFIKGKLDKTPTCPYTKIEVKS